MLTHQRQFLLRMWMVPPSKGTKRTVLAEHKPQAKVSTGCNNNPVSLLKFIQKKREKNNLINENFVIWVILRNGI